MIVKAAALMRAIMAEHPFTDGNERTAMLAELTFLNINDVIPAMHEPDIEDFAVEIAIKKLDVTAISAWLSLKIS